MAAVAVEKDIFHQRGIGLDQLPPVKDKPLPLNEVWRRSSSGSILMTMSRPAKCESKVPHAFVVEALAPVQPQVRRLFSGLGVYGTDRLLLILREKAK